jgi:hypothetical protein
MSGISIFVYGWNLVIQASAHSQGVSAREGGTGAFVPGAHLMLETSKVPGREEGASPASVGLPNYSARDKLGVWYKLVNIGLSTNLVSPHW